MINKDFYPTPNAVIERMLAGHEVNGKRVLEPSAGKGNIVNYLNSLGCEVSYCETEPVLQKVLNWKGNFLCSDFLTTTPEMCSHFDFIVMNPPFSADEKHILHAYEVAPDGCTIIAICNSQTIENRFSRLRSQLGRIVDQFGTYSNIGSVFIDSERTTNVEIGLVTIYKPAKEQDDWSEYFDENEEVEEQENGIMSYNVVRECVNRYVGACKLFDEVAENAVKMKQIAGEFGVSSISFTLSVDEKAKSVDQFKVDLRKKAWGWIFSKMNLEKYMTTNLKSDLNKFVETQKQIPFTMKNIYKMLDVIVQTNGQRIDKAVVEVFEAFTAHHHENRYNIEGWKTNSHYMINKKIIVPYIGEQGKWHNHPEIAYNNRNYNHLEDFQKCLCTLTGTNFDSIPNLHHGFFSAEYSGYGADKKLVRESKDWGVWYDWGFFEIKIFKKGTLHMKFKDIDVWAMFNRKYAEINGFELPEKL